MRWYIAVILISNSEPNSLHENRRRHPQLGSRVKKSAFGVKLRVVRVGRFGFTRSRCKYLGRSVLNYNGIEFGKLIPLRILQHFLKSTCPTRGTHICTIFRWDFMGGFPTLFHLESQRLHRSNFNMLTKTGKLFVNILATFIQHLPTLNAFCSNSAKCG